MFTFKISEQFLTREEREIFSAYLSENGLDTHIWDVFECLFQSGVRNTRPFLLRAYQDDELTGAVILIRCRKYGKALFNHPVLSGTIDLIRIPFYLWIRFGCCMDMMSNPGFIKDPDKSEEVFSAMIDFMRKNFFMTIIMDYSRLASHYPGSSTLPALPHGLIDTRNMSGVEDYSKNFKNIKRKKRVFRNKGGVYSKVDNKLSEDHLTDLKKCFITTSERSVIYLPYQDLYLNTTITTSRTPLKNVFYFVATLNGEFLGYQAAIQTGKRLNALHGAFDRNRKTTYHAYDILFEKMTEYAIENQLELVDVGPIVNYTKEKMVNQTIPMSYFLFSKYKSVQKLYNTVLKITKIQGRQQMKFRKK
jgi:hypothetical protein